MAVVVDGERAAQHDDGRLITAFRDLSARMAHVTSQEQQLAQLLALAPDPAIPITFTKVREMLYAIFIHFPLILFLFSPCLSLLFYPLLLSYVFLFSCSFYYILIIHFSCVYFLYHFISSHFSFYLSFYELVK